jgi:UPF0271 protein
MSRTVRLALDHGVKIGAHPSYPDREHFGRVSMKLPLPELQLSIQAQLSALAEVLKEEKTGLHHIKPHGALYNDMVGNRSLAVAFLDAIAQYKNACFLFVPYGSVIAGEAHSRGYNTKHEAFADRRYLQGYSLAPRQMHGAVITSPEAVLGQLAGMVKNKRLKTLDNLELPMEAQTYCIHGDTPSAFQILTYLAEELPNQGIYLKK